ncbi:hypothetical protein TNCV_755051 [Trichonephila clavipes]|nr:hypothetical protein TNCV_755051 [Trichonephila clavipes]
MDCSSGNEENTENISRAGSSFEEFVAVDSDDENKMNNATPVPTSNEMRNIMKSMRSYCDSPHNGEMNNKRDDIEQLVGNLRLKKTTRKKSDHFPKAQ